MSDESLDRGSPSIPSIPPVWGRTTPPRSPNEIPPAPPSQAESSNVLGVVGFIASILGCCLPIVPSIVAVVCGVIGVRRAPRGYAIAAIVIGGLQLLAGAGFFIFAVVLAPASSSPWSALLPNPAQLNTLEQSTVDGATKFDEPDAWGTAFRVEVIERDGEQTVFYWSAGEDMVFDTPDDFVAGCDPESACNPGSVRDPAADKK